MSRTPLARMAGPIALATGGLLLVQQLLMVTILDRSQIEATMASPMFVPLAVLYFVAFCGLLATLITTYAWQAERAGVFGAIGFLAAIIGTMFLAGDLWFEAFAVPWLGNVARPRCTSPAGCCSTARSPATSCLRLAGSCTASRDFRARVFPRLISVAIMIGGLIGFQGALPPFAIPLALAVAWLGIWMLRSAVVVRTASAKALAA